MRLNLILLFFIYLPSIIPLQMMNLVSSALDFIPGVGNVKSLGEAISGKDLVTGEKLSKTERTLSLLGAIPGGNWLKNGKHLKNGQKFLKAAQRATKAGKLKNAIKFGKASARAMAKANKVQNIVRNLFKAGKAFFRQKGKEENTENKEKEYENEYGKEYEKEYENEFENGYENEREE